MIGHALDNLAGRVRRAFTLLEVMIVVVVIGILAAMVIPKFTGVTEDARSSSLQGSLAGVRGSITAYRTNAVISGQPPFPSLSQLTTVGTVCQQELPVNPYNNLRSVQAVSLAQATARTVINQGQYGWNYYVDNSATPPVAIIYANSDTATTIANTDGSMKGANQL